MEIKGVINILKKRQKELEGIVYGENLNVTDKRKDNAMVQLFEVTSLLLIIENKKELGAGNPYLKYIKKK